MTAIGRFLQPGSCISAAAFEKTAHQIRLISGSERPLTDPRAGGDLVVLTPVFCGECQVKAMRLHRLNFVHKAPAIICHSWLILRHTP